MKEYENTSLAFVCQRYGTDVNGGAELHCRQLAERLSRYCEVTVYTTCAIDYSTWEDHYAPGEEVTAGVRVKRFPVARKRDKESFDALSDRIFSNAAHSDEDEERWIEEQGPVCPGLLETLYTDQERYTAIVFMTYLYYLTARGLPMDFRVRKYLIPTVHDEPPVYLRYYDRVFGSATGFIWNTVEERSFAYRRFPELACRAEKTEISCSAEKTVIACSAEKTEIACSAEKTEIACNAEKTHAGSATPDVTGEVIAGVGIELPAGPLPDIPGEISDDPYIVYVGRIDGSKGCDEMFHAFRKYKLCFGGRMKLVLIGKPVMDIPAADDIIPLGFVSEEMKYAVIKGAVALVLFSQYESLSMAVLESMAVGCPVLVNGRCDVLKGQCVRSGAGLFFENDREFALELDYLISHEKEYRLMQENGVRYVGENYRWDVIINKILNLVTGG